MKKIHNTNKGFTLVELIIVITILAILGTIWFVSFQWYTADARDTKRVTDLSSLVWALESKRAGNSLSLVSFVDNSINSRITAANVYIAWKDVATSTWEYDAWIMKFALLWISAESFRDPNGFDYSFGATILKNWQYQFAAKLENWEIPQALIVWNYSPRTVEDSKVTWVVTARDNKKFQISSTADYSKLIVWDTVSDWTIDNLVVKSISSDLKYITVDWTITSWATTLELAHSEIEWLIWNYATGWDTTLPVVDKSTTLLPY